MSASSRELLDTAYTKLGYANGSLISASATPDTLTSQDWVNKGDWLTLAKKVSAEKVFFVNDYPVIVFAEQTSTDPTAWMHHFNSVWCMARPQMLFLAREGELAVLNLTRPPARPGEQREGGGRLLDIVSAVARVQEQLSGYRRDKVESGRLFEEERFGVDDRADRALIRDLGLVRTALIKDGLSPGHAHSLIGRSIFVRYLEDRGVLTEQYFRKVINKGRKEYRTAWNRILDGDTAAVAAVRPGRDVYYPRVLNNKLFTYALFKDLSEDFNGDMFPVNDEEELAVSEKHLKLLRRFLLGDIEGGLFFFAYRFDIIPIELISSIYETFYSLRPNQQREDGSYYTPAALVDFVLAQTLTDDQLIKHPRVLDPACGSGIFLVESFRRIVRHRCKASFTRLTAEELRGILRDQIRGIDINREAIRVAAFSLYLAMLHYLEPPDILQHKLPSLTYTRRTRRDPQRHLDILLVSDAFDVEANLANKAALSRFAPGAADVVVGNPPWGAPKVDDELSSDGGVKWCNDRGLSVGDKERSQSFIHRTMEFLVDGGRAGLLISTGVFFKRHDKTRAFRDQWLENTTLRNIVNFAAVRNSFFRTEGSKKDEGKGAIAPFASVVFDKVRPTEESRFTYWSAKETAFVTRVQAVILNRADFSHVGQFRFLRDATLWKIYWWGGHRDEALIQRLRLEKTLLQEFDSEGDNFRIGFLEAKKDQSSSPLWFRNLREFPTRSFERYGSLPIGRFIATPSRVKRHCEKELYEGPRLLIKRGIGSDGVVARYETEKFCFRHSIYCITIPLNRVKDAKVALGILWSSLTQYYLFMTSGSWGMWHDEVLKETYATIPLRLPTSPLLGEHIRKLVDELRAIPEAASEGSLFHNIPTIENRAGRVKELESELNDAVFDLFELTEYDRERVKDLCDLGLDLFYNGISSRAAKAIGRPPAQGGFGRAVDLCESRSGEMTTYLRTFLGLWEPMLRKLAGNFLWRIIRPPGDSSVMAVIFQTERAVEPLPSPVANDEAAWEELLRQLANNSRQMSFAKQVYIDGFIRVVTESDIIILKRNERRLWTASAAAEDAEATMLMAMVRPSSNGIPDSGRA